MHRPARKWLRRLGAGWVGMGVTMAAAFWAGYSFNAWTKREPMPPVAVTGTAISTVKSTVAKRAENGNQPTSDNTLSTGTVYVRRDGSALRDEPKWSAHTLAHKDRGTAVAILAPPHDGWAKVQIGDAVGWMRASILGDNPATQTSR